MGDLREILPNYYQKGMCVSVHVCVCACERMCFISAQHELKGMGLNSVLTLCYR